MTTRRLMPEANWSSESTSRSPDVRHRLKRKLATGLLGAGLIVQQAFGQIADPGFAPDINGGVYAISVQPDGKILIGGAFSVIDGIIRSNIARLHPDGSVDSGFNPGADGEVTSLAVQADGRVLAGGLFGQLGASARIRLGRLNPNGTVDPGFKPAATGGGSTSWPFLPVIHCLAVQADGKMLVGGAFTELDGRACTNLGRLSADGTVDSNFCAQADSDVVCIAVQSDGKLLIGGSFLALDGQSRMGLGRLNPDGSLDASFNPALDYALYSISCLLVQPDGKILVAGGYPLDPFVARKFVRRLNQDGSLDLSFYQSTTVEPYLPLSYSVFTLALQADGKILVGGDFAILAGESQGRVGRLNADGTLDATFHPSLDNTNASWPQTCVVSLAPQADGKLLAAGLFTELGGQPCTGFARLAASGPITQSLAVSAPGTELTWTRNGPVAELAQVTFERSSDGTNYAFLGSALWTNGGWHLSGLTLPFGQRFILRARGRTIGGAYTACTGLIESTQEFFLAPKIEGMETPGDGTLTLTCTGAPTQACVLLTAERLGPSGQWTPLATNVADINGLVRFAGVEVTDSAQRFFRLRQ